MLFFNSSPSLLFANSMGCVFMARSDVNSLSQSRVLGVCGSRLNSLILSRPKEFHQNAIRLNELFEKCDLFDGEISLHDFCAMSS